MSKAVKTHLAVAMAGIALGFVLSRSGFASWDEVHAMFTFADWRLTLGFAMAVVMLAVAWPAIARAGLVRWPPRAIHPGTLPGALLFGTGWALAGACPGIVFVQIGEGQLGALATLGGIVVGNALYAVVHERSFRWSQASCADV